MSNINKEKQAAVPQKLLHELFDYDSTTGEWVNLINRSPTARVGQPAGSVKKDGYVQIVINGLSCYAHRLVWTYIHGDYPDGSQPYVDHINGKRDDNRLVNLRVNSTGENQRNQKMASRNNSGTIGVCRDVKTKRSGKIYVYWVATWRNENGKNRQKGFPAHKLGEDEAKQLAIDFRAEQIRLLKINHGITYSTRHGT